VAKNVKVHSRRPQFAVLVTILALVYSNQVHSQTQAEFREQIEIALQQDAFAVGHPKRLQLEKSIAVFESVCHGLDGLFTDTTTRLACRWPALVSSILAAPENAESTNSRSLSALLRDTNASAILSSKGHLVLRARYLLEVEALTPITDAVLIALDLFKAPEMRLVLARHGPGLTPSSFAKLARQFQARLQSQSPIGYLARMRPFDVQAEVAARQLYPCFFESEAVNVAVNQPFDSNLLGSRLLKVKLASVGSGLVDNKSGVFSLFPPLSKEQKVLSRQIEIVTRALDLLLQTRRNESADLISIIEKIDFTNAVGQQLSSCRSLSWFLQSLGKTEDERNILRDGCEQARRHGQSLDLWSVAGQLPVGADFSVASVATRPQLLSIDQVFELGFSQKLFMILSYERLVGTGALRGGMTGNESVHLWRGANLLVDLKNLRELRGGICTEQLRTLALPMIQDMNRFIGDEE
jgi:hypothetical protein